MKPNQTTESADLRQRAEERLQRQKPPTEAPLTTDKVCREFHELHVHQIELEMQNEELRNSRVLLEASVERYTDLYDFAPAGYFTLSSDGTIVQTNLVGARLLNLERGRLTGRRFKTFVSKSKQADLNTFFTEIFKTHSKQSCEVTLEREGQPPLVVAMDGTLSADGLECRAVVSDITERKFMEGQLRQAQKMEAVGQLASGAAHDFNNVLSALQLNLRMLSADTQLSAQAAELVQELLTDAKRATCLTRQLLLFSRHHSMNAIPLDLNELLANLLNMVRRLVEENIRLKLEPQDEWLFIKADASMIEQVVVNLCVNARDAMPHGGRLTLTTQEVDVEISPNRTHSERIPGRHACLRVMDTGSGIEKSVINRIFDPFFTTKPEGKGTGMGLATVHGIVKQHGGWIEVESLVGHGSTFSIFLPLAAQAPAAPLPCLPNPTALGGKETILLVEDEASVRLSTGACLTGFGYKVLEAGDTKEALVLWKKHRRRIELLICDMVLSGNISGLELAMRLNEGGEKLPFIITSGYTDQNEFADTVANFLPKPYDEAALLAMVRSALDPGAKPNINT